MKRLITICAVVVIMCALPNVAQAVLWEIQDAGLLDTTNFINTISGTNGNLNSRSDIPGNPGTQFNITLTGSGWTDITIGDSFDLPFNNAGFSANVIPIGAGGMGDLSSPYTGYTMSIENPGTAAFVAALYMNTGWTDSPRFHSDSYYQDTAAGTVVAPGATETLILNFSSAAWWNGTAMVSGQTVLYPDEVSNIGFKIGANLGNRGEVPSGIAFNVNVVPEPGTIALLGLGSLSLIRARRKTRV